MQPKADDAVALKARPLTVDLKVSYRGEERTTALPLTPHIIGQLALEAGVRGLGIAELVGELVSLTLEKGLAHRVLDGGPHWTVGANARRPRHRLYRRVSSCRG
jgi:hypothetical protein